MAARVATEWLGDFRDLREAACLQIRFYLDPENDEPHIHRHNVAESEVEDVLRQPLEDRPGRDGARVAVGRTSGGRYLRVVYVPGPEPQAIFVVTAFSLQGQALRALRRRLKKKS